MDEHDPVVQVLEAARRLPASSVSAAFARYGRPLEDPAPELDPEVGLDDGTKLGRLRYRAQVDVIANDHFVLLRADAEPLAMPGPLFAAVVGALGRRDAG